MSKYPNEGYFFIALTTPVSDSYFKNHQFSWSSGNDGRRSRQHQNNQIDLNSQPGGVYFMSLMSKT